MSKKLKNFFYSITLLLAWGCGNYGVDSTTPEIEILEPTKTSKVEISEGFNLDTYKIKQDSIKQLILESLPNESIKSSPLQELYIRGLLKLENEVIKFELPFNLHDVGNCMAPDCFSTDISFEIPFKPKLTFPQKVNFEMHQQGCIPEEIRLKNTFSLFEQTDSMVNYYCSALKSNLIIESNSGLIYFPHEENHSMSNVMIDKMYSFEFEEGIGPNPYSCTVMFSPYEEFFK